MSELARGGIVSGTGFTGWFEPEGLETFIPFNAEQVARIRRNAGIIAATSTTEPVTFDSMGSPIFVHQLPPEEPSDER